MKELIIGDISDHYLVLSETTDVLHVYIGDKEFSDPVEYILDRGNTERVYEYLGKLLNG